MKKPKKITVKFFLNTFLNPIDIGNGEWGYPLYAQVTYNRMNTQIKTYYGKFYTHLDKVNEDDPYLLNFEERNFRKTMEYEIEQQGDLFADLRGLGKKYEKYCQPIHQLFNAYLKARLQSETLHRVEPARFSEIIDYRKRTLDFFTVLDAAGRLFDNMEMIISSEFKTEMDVYAVYCELYKEVLQDPRHIYPTVIDWLNGRHYKELEEKLEQYYVVETEKISFTLTTISRIIISKMEMMRWDR